MVPPRPATGYAWVFAAVVFQSCSAVFGKFGGLAGADRGMVGALLNPWLLAVFAMLGSQAICWLLALRRLPLGMAYPFMSLTLPLTLLASRFVFEESFGWANLLGTILMAAGIAILAGKSPSR